MKTTVKTVTIDRPFQLPRMAEPHLPGTFELQIDEEPLDVVWEGYHRTVTLFLTSDGLTEAWPVSEEKLAKAMASH
ncbi:MULTISPECIES: hypothetical protein [Rhizobium]|uniref:Uncharacterized protein n=1 Tax=Rhizobium wenxiniae TaxID=1737357 RepID=A0A7X0D367_9HYPH|nr:hypothetical protein [Rhizobium wenxiniae]MBB6165206.1 hypothetical protein [Rhizobium wenxiniae]